MVLDNHTSYPAALMRTVIDGDDPPRFAAAILTRVTFVVGPDGEMTPGREQPWPVSMPPWDGPYGPMPSDEVFYRGGVDVFLFGHARAPRSRPVSRLDVSITVGSFRRAVVVFGDRVWRRQGSALVPSRPKPFTAIPFTPSHSFGGKDEWDELPVAFPDNPDGKGFYLTEEAAEGKPMPNVEDPTALVARWDDRPPVVGLGPLPMGNSLGVRNGTEYGPDGRPAGIKPTLFNQAFPDMIAQAVHPGDVGMVFGATPEQVFQFTVPPPPVRGRLTFDDEVIDCPLAVDQVGIEPDKNRVFVTYRYAFRYKLYARQRRKCELLPAD